MPAASRAAAAAAAHTAAGSGMGPLRIRCSPKVEATGPWRAWRSRRSRSAGLAARQGGASARRDLRCPGFVGEGSRIAGEYHDADFEWEEVEEEGRAAVARQLREWAEWQAGGQAGLVGGPSTSSTRRSRRNRRSREGTDTPSLSRASSDSTTDTTTTTSSSSSDSNGSLEDCSEAPGGGEREGASWERFHATHSQARFFKEKRYLMLEFPALGKEDPPQHIAEIGCGCGSALLPVLKANSTCRVTGCDVSPTALGLLRRAAEQAGIDIQRIHTFVLDASLPGEAMTSSSSSSGSNGGSDLGIPDGRSSPGGSPLAGLEADSLLLVFTLSALRPEEHPAALAHAYAALRAGGLLLFRDYGLYDMAQLRFPGSQMLGENLYRRSEGTLAYFFSTQALRELALAAGFEEVECQYARVQLQNRKNGTAMRRVFLHGVFRRPAAEPAAAA